MGHRILMGTLIPRQSSGNATIYFEPHDVTGDADGADLQELGDKSDFTQPPASFVSLKRFTFQDKNDPRPEIPEPSWWEISLNNIRSLIDSTIDTLNLQDDRPKSPEIEPNQTTDQIPRVVMESYEIKNEAPSTEQMVIRWKATNGAAIKEVAYLIIGDA